mgnify:FL=1
MEAEAKEPWQMTKEEFAKSLKEEKNPLEGSWATEDFLVMNDGSKIARGRNEKERIGGIHRLEVKQAIADGLPVPANVLAEYPDLQAKEDGKADHPITQQLLSIKEKLSTITSRDEAAEIDKSVSREIYDEIKRYDSSLAYNLMKKAEVGLPAALSLNKGVKTGKDSLYYMAATSGSTGPKN